MLYSKNRNICRSKNRFHQHSAVPSKRRVKDNYASKLQSVVALLIAKLVNGIFLKQERHSKHPFT